MCRTCEGNMQHICIISVAHLLQNCSTCVCNYFYMKVRTHVPDVICIIIINMTWTEQVKSMLDIAVDIGQPSFLKLKLPKFEIKMENTKSKAIL